MAGKFEIYKDKKGEHRFRLKSSNGQNVLASEGYKSKAGCLNGVKSVMKNSTDHSRFALKTTRGGKHMFNLKSGNHQIIGTSESYESTSSRDNGVKSVMKNAPKAKIDDLTK